jgi:hypothetical protein
MQYNGVSPVKINCRFGGIFRVHFKDRRLSQTRKHHKVRQQVDNPEDIDDNFFRNIEPILNYAALESRTCNVLSVN